MAVIKEGTKTQPFKAVEELEATAGDSKPLDYVFRVGQAPRDISRVETVIFKYRPQNGGTVDEIVADRMEKGVRVNWEAAPQVPGIYRVEWMFVYDDGSTETLPREYMRIRTSL